MKIGEVRVIELDGKPVWMKRLAENFYVLNGVYCAGDGTEDMESPDVIGDYLECATDKDIVYPGANDGWVVMFMQLPDGGYCVGFTHLGMYGHVVSAENCGAALHEYEAWSA